MIVYKLAKIVYCKFVKTIINITEQVKVTIDVVIRHHKLSNSIMSNENALFMSKFWSFSYSFLDIKYQLFTFSHS